MKATKAFAIQYRLPEQPVVSYVDLDSLNMQIELRFQSLAGGSPNLRIHMTPMEARELASDLLDMAMEAQVRGFTDTK